MPSSRTDQMKCDTSELVTASTAPRRYLSPAERGRETLFKPHLEVRGEARIVPIICFNLLIRTHPLSRDEFPLAPLYTSNKSNQCPFFFFLAFSFNVKCSQDILLLPSYIQLQHQTRLKCQTKLSLSCAFFFKNKPNPNPNQDLSPPTLTPKFQVSCQAFASKSSQDGPEEDFKHLCV